MVFRCAHGLFGNPKVRVVGWIRKASEALCKCAGTPKLISLRFEGAQFFDIP